MRTFLMAVGGFIALAVAFIVWRIYATHAGGRRAYMQLAARIAPVAEAIGAGRAPSPADLERFARDRTTRQVLHDLLKQTERLSVFPREFLTWEAMAEANLIGWLNHPNELASPPDEIELMKKVPAPGSDGHYFVFRYRVLEPHWAAKDGWMAGVAGPYDLSGEPAPYARGTFSRFEAYDSRTPEDHVEVTHRAVIERKK
jgi:hypothetical protein